MLISTLVNLKSDASWTNVYSNYCRCKSSGGVVTVRGIAKGDYTLTQGSYKAISTLPSGYRPTETVYFTGMDMSGNANINGTVETDGIVYLYTNSTNVSYWAYSCTFVI